MSFGPASPDAGVELLRQLFLQCSDKILASYAGVKISKPWCEFFYDDILGSLDSNSFWDLVVPDRIS